MATKQFQQLLSQAKRVVVLTGAGVSAESGIPTFRGEGGLWRKYVSGSRPGASAEVMACFCTPLLMLAVHCCRTQLC